MTAEDTVLVQYTCSINYHDEKFIAFKNRAAARFCELIDTMGFHQNHQVSEDSGLRLERQTYLTTRGSPFMVPATLKPLNEDGLTAKL